MKGADESRRQPVVRTTLEAIYAFTHVLAPVIPIACKSVFDNLHTPPRSLRTLNLDFYNLSAGTKVDVGEILFHKIDIDGKMEANSGKQSVNKGEKATKQVAKANSETTVQKKDDKKKSNDTAIVEDPNQPLISKIDLRVGKITKVWNHETADRLYCEEIDVGEATVRPIASGLRQYYTLEEMQNRLVIVVCNLKEAKMQGFVSTGMVLAAKAKDKVELVSPPANARVGDRVLTSSVLQQIHSNPAWIPWIPNKVKKNKVWETLAEGLRSNAEGIACLQNEPLCTEGGNCYVISVVNAPIS
jgi:methionine--tRNA ligase beta chain